jgi:DnaK suppressor protein
MSAAARAPVKLDQDSVGRLSRVDAMQVQEMALAAERRRIDAALTRLADGDFGFCLTCGEEISARRLQHDPSVSQCLARASGKNA